MPKVQIHPSWAHQLKSEFEQPYFKSLVHFIKEEIANGKKIYPPGRLIFNAFDQTPFEEVKVVIIGQDPYHGMGEAMGLSFSVPKGIRIPPSLRNIFKELHQDVGFHIPSHGDLTSWAKQGVFLLNAILTVEHKRPGSHKNAGWQAFTDAVIQKISMEREGIVFLLWGNFARSKATMIDTSKHIILESPHPSPLARGGFFDNHHFSKVNELLKKAGKAPIDWQV